MKILDRNGKQFTIGDRIQSPNGYVWRINKISDTGLVEIVETTNWLVSEEQAVVVGDEGRVSYGLHPEMFCPVDPMKPFRRPVRGTQKSIGYDLYLSDCHTILSTGVSWDEVTQTQRRPPEVLSTNTRVNFPEGWGGLICDRSSTGKSGMHCVGGVVDNDYKGELRICIVNFMEHRQVVVGDRLAQLVMVPYFREPEEDAIVLDKGDRGTKGFGSTGQ